MINILFIAFEFPPLNHGGVHRSLAFVKYLPQFGINPVVITLQPSSYGDVFMTFETDDKLGKEVRDKSSIIHVPSKKRKPQTRIGEFVSIYFSILGNEVKSWKGDYFLILPELISKYKPEAIFATVPPFSILPLVQKTAKQYKIPLLLDFRDAWSQWRTSPYGTRIHYWVNLGLERKYLSDADSIIATSLQTIADFKQLHPGIRNSYDSLYSQWLRWGVGKLAAG